MEQLTTGLREYIVELEQEEANLQDMMSKELDDSNVQAFTNQINIVRNRLSEKRHELIQLEAKEQQRADEIEAKVQAEAVPFHVVGVDLEGIPTPIIQYIEEIVKIDRKRILNEHAIELEQLETDHYLKDQERIKEYSVLEDMNRITLDNEQRLLSENLELSKKVEALESRQRDYELLIEDAESKRDAAVAEKESLSNELIVAQHTINELNTKIADYEQAAEYKTREDKPIVANDEDKTVLQAKADAVKKLFTHTENWGSVEKVYKPDGSFEVVPRSELSDWEPADVIPPSIEVPMIPQFQDDSVQEHTMDREVDEEATGHNTVTREEFEALRHEVTMLAVELKARHILPHNWEAA